MGVRISPSKTFKAQVDFTIMDESGKKEAQSFMAEFKRLPAEEVKQLIDDKLGDREICNRVLCGWDMRDIDTREPIPFSDANLDAFLLIPGAAGVVALRFIETAGASRQKN